jgi:glycolate oxidase iron-sulfur subunit
MDLRRLLFLGWFIRLYQRLGIQWLIRSSGVMKLMPKRLQELEAMTPTIPKKFSSGMIRTTTPSKEGRSARYRVAFLTGCAQDLIFSQINRDCVEVLSWNGCEVYSPKHQYCCGSLHAHNGETELARQLAIKQLEQFPPERFDAIISNAGGCGSHMKHYQAFLKDDPVWGPRAKLWDSKVKDIHEWLEEIGFEPPAANPHAQKIKVTYHESCHLADRQKVTRQPRSILHSIPNLELIELPESDWCCGSAGIYNITQPVMANKLLDRKIANILKTGAEIVANGNSGCMLQLINGMKERKLSIRVAHPITLLAEAYRHVKKDNAPVHKCSVCGYAFQPFHSEESLSWQRCSRKLCVISKENPPRPIQTLNLPSSPIWRRHLLRLLSGKNSGRPSTAPLNQIRKTVNCGKDFIFPRRRAPYWSWEQATLPGS